MILKPRTYRGSEKYRNYSSLYKSVVTVASPLSLVDGFFFAGQSEMFLFLLSAAGFVAVTFLSSSFLSLPLNGRSVVALRGASSPRQEFASTFWMQSCVCFSGSVALKNNMKQKMKTDFHFHISWKMYALLVRTYLTRSGTVNKSKFVGLGADNCKFSVSRHSN